MARASLYIGRRIESSEGRGRMTSSETNRRKMTRAIGADPHFWIPICVLLAGLAVLRWIS